MTNDTNDLEQQNKAERDKLLHSIFTRTAKAIDNILKNTDPAELKASMLQSINTFLRINDISSDTIPDEDEDTRETRELATQVRALDDDMTPEERRQWDEGNAQKAALQAEFGEQRDDDDDV